MNRMEVRKKRAKEYIVPIIFTILLAGVLIFQDDVSDFFGGFLDGVNDTHLMEPR